MADVGLEIAGVYLAIVYRSFFTAISLLGKTTSVLVSKVSLI